MSEFYINSKKSNLSWEKLDASKMDNVNKYENQIQFCTSENKDVFQVEELKSQLHNEFSHILNSEEKYETRKRYGENKEDISFYNKASDTLLEIEKIAGIEKSENNHIDNVKNNSQDLLILLNELRVLTEKRSKISNEINSLDNSLINVQKKLLDKKRDYDKKISNLKSMSSIYEQSARLVSKIISEDTNYEQI